MLRYVIKRGDTLSEIAVRNRVSTRRLRAFNGITGDRIRSARCCSFHSPRAAADVAGDDHRSAEGLIAEALRIRPLSDFVANQIAAGEVVERPASIVKELLENSLDAGATTIRVDVEQAGVGRIRVRDDGCGIHPEDLRLAVSRHATSKIVAAGDLASVSTSAFAAKPWPAPPRSRTLTILSRAAGADRAWTLEVAGGEERFLRPAAHPFGTTVEVAELFYNTPARRKFLKTERTELLHIQETVRRIALANAAVGFELAAGSRSLDGLAAGGDWDARASALFGERFMAESVAVDESGGDMRLWGRVGLPTHSDARATRQHFFVNGRPVRDRLAGHAVRQAYRDVLFHGRHPVFALFLELPPNLVDVNVHPAKDEVRFRRSRDVHDFIFGKLAKVLRDVRPGDRSASDRLASGAQRRPLAPRRRAFASNPKEQAGRVSRASCTNSRHGNCATVLRTSQPTKRTKRAAALRPWATPWRNCTASTCWRRTTPGW